MRFIDIFPYLIIVVLIYLLASGNKAETLQVEIPGKHNKYTRVDPQPIIKYDTIFKDSLVEKVVRVENPVNKELLAKYNSAKDSLSKLQLYKSAITERTYFETYLDNNQTIQVKSEVIGTLKRQQLTYDIPKLTKAYKNPSQGLYLGVGVQVNYLRIKLPQPEVNLSYLKGTQMYSIGVNPEHIRINYKRKIF